jgi:hypothetical protein
VLWRSQWAAQQQQQQPCIIVKCKHAVTSTRHHLHSIYLARFTLCCAVHNRELLNICRTYVEVANTHNDSPVVGAGVGGAVPAAETVVVVAVAQEGECKGQHKQLLVCGAVRCCTCSKESSQSMPPVAAVAAACTSGSCRASDTSASAPLLVACVALSIQLLPALAVTLPSTVYYM